MIDNLCPHGRITTAYCEPCKAQEYAGAMPPTADPQNGLNATYYDFPPMTTAQDMIEYLDLNFSQGNILKSLIRENNPNAKKETTTLYEAEKRFFYAKRDLRALQEKECSHRDGLGLPTEGGLEDTTEG